MGVKRAWQWCGSVSAVGSPCVAVSRGWRRAEGIGGVGPDWLNHYAKPRINGKWKECEASKLGKGQTRVAEVTLGSREWIMWELLRL